MQGKSLTAIINQNIDDFYTKKIPITVCPDDDRKNEFTWHHSQRDVISTVDLYYNSVFKSGKYDEQGRQKIFLNVGKFRTDVATMQIDIDISNFLFLPTTSDLWSPWFLSKDFHQWAHDNDYGQIINDLGDDLPKYGTCVIKRVGKELKRVPLGRLLNTQNAQSLKQAFESGGYVIEALSMTPHEVENYPDWNTDALEDSDESFPVYERYGLITVAHIKLAKNEKPDDKDWDEWFPGIAVMAKQAKHEKANDRELQGAILFAERVTDFPYEECHWKKQDGRWLGVGEMKNQFQNQLAANINMHLRQKSLYWAAKKIFQSTDDSVANNFAREVEDGDVIMVAPNGQLSQINMQSQHLGDFQALDNVINQNADQLSFSYEAATGESPKAGTAFSLQVQLDNTLQKHYGKKRENYGLFLKRAFFNQTLDIFKKDKRKEHVLTFAYGEDESAFLQEAMVRWNVQDRRRKNLFAGKLSDSAQLEAEVREEMMQNPYLVVDIPDKFYDEAKYHTKLELTGEQTDVNKDNTTLTTLWQTLDAKQDPRAEKVLAMILANAGKNMQLIGSAPAKPAQPVAPMSPVKPSIQNEVAV